MTITESKIVNALKYFVKNTQNMGLTKLLKLLYFWDFYYFEKHGKSITGFKYFAYPFGPVPKELYESIDTDTIPEYIATEIDFAEIAKEPDEESNKRFNITLKNKDVDLDIFAPYEKEMLDRMVEIFKTATAKDMTEASHFHNQPWKITIDTKGEFQEIDYMLGKSKDTPFDEEEIKERMFLQNELTHNGHNQ